MIAVSVQSSLAFAEAAVGERPGSLLPGRTPFYSTPRGDAYLGDSAALLRDLPAGSLNAVVTSPPYALHFQKEYGNAAKADYVEWFLPFAEAIHAALADDGSFVLNIGGSYEKGRPTRSLYHFKLLIALVEEVGFHLAQECFWYNPAKMPVPAEWVTVRRVRVKDSVEYVWWLSKTPWPKASNRKVLRPYSKDMERLRKRKLKATTRPSGHAIRPSFARGDAGGSIPPNMIDGETPTDFPEDDFPEDLLRFGNNAANDGFTRACKESGRKIHPARFPAPLPEFFVKLLTDDGDLVLDPFAGSNMTGAICERLGRRWIACEQNEQYLDTSRLRFSCG